MFKRGQLVRSRISNLYGVVTAANCEMFKLTLVTGKRKGYLTYWLNHDDVDCELVGNNYKEAENA